MPARLRFLLVVGAAVAAASPALAHKAPTGWRYDSWCCGGQDCQPIPAENVSVTEDGYVVSLPEGTHLTARRNMTKLFGYDEVKESGDGYFHACVLPHSQEFRCLYAPRFVY